MHPFFVTHKTLLLCLAVVVCLCIGAAALLLPNPRTTPLIELDGTVYTLEVAATDSAKERGLGGRSGLPADRGMMFVYGAEHERCFWMKDMRFSIDIIWIAANGNITSIEPRLAPSTYPRLYCANAAHVIELPAGSADKHDLIVGQTLEVQ